MSPAGKIGSLEACDRGMSPATAPMHALPHATGKVQAACGTSVSAPPPARTSHQRVLNEATEGLKPYMEEREWVTWHKPWARFDNPEMACDFEAMPLEKRHDYLIQGATALDHALTPLPKMKGHRHTLEAVSGQHSSV